VANIHILDAQTANLIAAGEVVERPANAIKELTENAIDAHGRSIVTEIREGGIGLLRITDDGCGMAKEDLPLALRRHATSKIRTGADLAAITTLGFRGEALAAISSTSRFTMMSKRREDPTGHQITASGEEIGEVEECGCADGTTVIVRDLFFNQPARKKFLKRPATEAGAILQYLQRLAVSHPEIAFRHISDGETKLQTPGNGKLSDAIYATYGKVFYNALVPLKETDFGPYRIHGFITRPEGARNNRSDQSFYINGRYVKSRTMGFALEDAYKSFVKSENFPGCVLFLELDADKVDVNVHPAKLEVRFADERGVYEAIYTAVRHTLSALSNRLAKDEYETAVAQKKTSLVPPIGEKEKAPAVSQEVQSGVFKENKAELPLFSPAKSVRKASFVLPEEELKPTTVIHKVNFFEDEEPSPLPLPKKDPTVAEPPRREPTVSVPPKKEPPKAAPLPETEPVQLTLTGEDEATAHPLLYGTIRGVLFDAFILYQTKDTVYLIDKHAAHERILYEALKKSHKAGGVQMLMEPVVIRTDAVEAPVLAEHLAEMEEAGFLLEEFGDSTFLLRGIPLEMTSLSADALCDLLRESAREMMLGGRGAGAGEKLFDRTLYSMACKAAVKAGIASTDEDHRWIVEKLREIDNVTVCPHGRPVLIAMTKKEIEAKFLRT